MQRRRRWGGRGGTCPPQVLGYQLTLFGPRGADYARHITTGPPIFLDDAASLTRVVIQGRRRLPRRRPKLVPTALLGSVYLCLQFCISEFAHKA